MIRFSTFLTEMARPMTRNGITYSIKGGKYFKNDGTGPVEIDAKEYEEAKGKKDTSPKKSASKKEYLAPNISKLEKPEEYVLYLSEPDCKATIKKIEQMSKLLSRCGGKPIQYTVKDVVKHITEMMPDYCEENGITKENDDTMYECKELTVKMIYTDITSKSGYTYIGTIDHAENLIFSNYEDAATRKALEQFRKRTVCDYCGVKRYRSKSCIFRNDETQELVQIGTKCLKDYIPIDIKNFITVVDFFREPFDEDEEEKVKSITSHSKLRWDVEDAIVRSVHLITKEGFHPSASDKSTKEKLIRSFGIDAKRYGNNIISTKEDYDIADKVVAYIKAEKTNTFLENARQIIANGTCGLSSIGFIPAAVYSYFKSIETAEERAEKERIRAEKKASLAQSQYYGEIGKKYTRELTLIKSYETESEFGYKTINGRCYIFLDDEKNRFVWYSSSVYNIKENDKNLFEFTVKAHNENKAGSKQTVITRAKIVKNDAKSTAMIEINKAYNKLTKGMYLCYQLVTKKDEGDFIIDYVKTNKTNNALNLIKKTVSGMRTLAKDIMNYKLEFDDLCVCMDSYFKKTIKGWASGVADDYEYLYRGEFSSFFIDTNPDNEYGLEYDEAKKKFEKMSFDKIVEEYIDFLEEQLHNVGNNYSTLSDYFIDRNPISNEELEELKKIKF